MIRKIKGFPYYITSNGIVFSYRKKAPLSTTWDKGYLTVSLRLNGKNYRKFVHQLVAKMFIKNSNQYRYVMHSNGQRDNNNINNLRWASGKDISTRTMAKEVARGKRKVRMPDKFKAEYLRRKNASR